MHCRPSKFLWLPFGCISFSLAYRLQTPVTAIAFQLQINWIGQIEELPAQLDEIEKYTIFGQTSDEEKFWLFVHASPIFPRFSFAFTRQLQLWGHRCIFCFMLGKYWHSFIKIPAESRRLSRHDGVKTQKKALQAREGIEGGVAGGRQHFMSCLHM